MYIDKYYWKELWASWASLSFTIFENLMIFIKSSNFLFIFIPKSSVLIFSYQTNHNFIISIRGKKIALWSGIIQGRTKINSLNYN